MLIFYKLIKGDISSLFQITKNKKLVSLFEINKILLNALELEFFSMTNHKNNNSIIEKRKHTFLEWIRACKAPIQEYLVQILVSFYQNFAEWYHWR